MLWYTPFSLPVGVTISLLVKKLEGEISADESMMKNREGCDWVFYW